jgi:catechol-2,3-dioxygenase
VTLAFGHVALRTNRLAAMTEWYCVALGARVVARAERAAFLSWDDAHHRIALVDTGPLAVVPADAVGVAHVAFRVPSVEALVSTFVRLRAAGMEPVRTVDHRVTASLYYVDPDGNQIELFADLTGAQLADVVDAPERTWDPLALAMT